MPHATAVARKASQKFQGLPNDGLRDEIRPALQAATSLRDAVERLGLMSGIEGQYVDDATVVLDAVPSGLGSALLAAVKDAVDRNVPVTFVWQAAYDYELRVWESVADDGIGGMTVMMTSPFPRHVRERSTSE